MERARTPLTGTVTATPDTRDMSMASSDEVPKPAGMKTWCSRCLRGSLPYIRDLLLVLCAVLVVIVIRRHGPASPGFFCRDDSITYRFLGDSVSVMALTLMTLLLPAAVILVVELLQQRRGWGWGCARPVWTAAVLSCRHVSCQAFLVATTEVVKCLVSRPRPSFLELCQPIGYNQTRCDHNYFISEFRCASLASETDHYRQLLVVDSMLSFPSGHSAISSCTATFLAVYLASRTRGRRRAVLRLWLMFFCALYACVVSFSRVTDHRHHLGDVLAGVALGVAAGLLLCYGACEEKLFGKSSQRRALMTQASVTSNRTSDTQTTSVDEVL